MRRAQHFSKNSFYVLKADVQKFFPSIDHPILLKQVTRKIKDRKVLDLCEKIIAHSNRQERVETYFPGDDLFTQLDRRKGLPIGNQTSQFFANVYLDALDHFIRDELAPRGYVRYVDDFLIFSNSKTQLCECREAIREYSVDYDSSCIHGNVLSPAAERHSIFGVPDFPHTSLAGETQCTTVSPTLGKTDRSTCNR